MSLTTKLKSAGLWQVFQIVSQIAIQFLYIAVMARLLEKQDFGLIAMASAFIGLGMVFSTGGMGSALIQRQDITQKHMNAAFQGSLLLGITVFIILFLASGSIAEFYNEPDLELIIKVIGLGVVFNSINSVSRSLLQKSFKFKITANITVLITFVSYALGIALAVLGYGVWSLIMASLSISILTAFVMFYYAPIKVSLNFHYKEFRQLFSYGFGIVLLGLNNYLSNGGLNLVLGKIFPLAMLGVFERTYLIKTLPSQYLGSVLDTIMFPAMSEIQDEEVRLFRMYQYSLGVVNTILMPITLFLIFFSKEIVLILLGNKWLDAVIPLQIMFMVLPFSASGRMADAVVRAKGYVYKNVIRKFIYAIVLISTTAFGAKNYGLTGAAIAVTLSYTFNYCIMLLLVRDIFKRSIIEIFWQPVLSGVKVSCMVFGLILIITTALYNWNHESIINFFVSTFFISGCMLLVALQKPEFFGVYLQEVLAKILSKRNLK